MSEAPVVLIAESAAERLIAAAHDAHPDETGGILLGVQADKRPWITTAVELPTNNRGTSHYRLPGGATHRAVLAARKDDPRVGYLGEWHSHPADVGPSATDSAMLRRLAYDMHIRLGPVLIIVRRTVNGHQLDVRKAFFPFLNPGRIVLTGDLLRPSDAKGSKTDGIPLAE